MHILKDKPMHMLISFDAFFLDFKCRQNDLL